jgi:hypothetical protein
MSSFMGIFHDPELPLGLYKAFSMGLTKWKLPLRGKLLLCWLLPILPVAEEISVWARNIPISGPCQIKSTFQEHMEKRKLGCARCEKYEGVKMCQVSKKPSTSDNNGT